MQTPEAQARPLPPHDVPSETCESAGQAAEVPVQVSAVSQRVSTAGRQTAPADCNRHCEVQQAELEGSQTAPLTNLQVVELQHGDPAVPGSQSSPGSRIPCEGSVGSLQP